MAATKRSRRATSARRRSPLATSPANFDRAGVRFAGTSGRPSRQCELLTLASNPTVLGPVAPQVRKLHVLPGVFASAAQRNHVVNRRSTMLRPVQIFSHPLAAQAAPPSIPLEDLLSAEILSRTDA
jgi:hypothetical protein